MSQRKVLPKKPTVAQLHIQFPVFTEHIGSLLFPPQPNSNPLT